jgi:hypothetical protein
MAPATCIVRGCAVALTPWVSATRAASISQSADAVELAAASIENNFVPSCADPVARLTMGLTYAALATFVFCSGFLLARRDVKVDPQGLWSFYVRRLLRIYPLDLIALVSFGIAKWQQILERALLTSMLTLPAMPTLWFVAVMQPGARLQASAGDAAGVFGPKYSKITIISDRKPIANAPDV